MNKTYFIEVVPREPTPKEGWDIAFRNMVMYVKAENEEEAKTMAIDYLESKNLYMKVSYIHEISANQVQ